MVDARNFAFARDTFFFFLISKENFIQRHNNESHIVMYASEMSNFSGMLWAL